MSSSDGEDGAWLQVGSGDDADLMKVRMTPGLPPDRVRWWQRATARLSPSRLLCAVTGHYLCRRWWRSQPLSVHSEWLGDDHR